MPHESPSPLIFIWTSLPRRGGCIWTIPQPVAPSEPANQLTAPVTPRTRRGGVIIVKPDDELAVCSLLIPSKASLLTSIHGLLASEQTTSIVRVSPLALTRPSIVDGANYWTFS